MVELISHPAFQGGVAPFLVALAIAAWGRRTPLAGLAAVAGFAVAALLFLDLASGPLTVTRKLAWIGFAAAAAGVLLDRVRALPSAMPLAVGVACASAGIWMLWNVLARGEASQVVIHGAPALLYVAWIAAAFDGLSARPIAAGSAGLALGVGTGMACILGASALLGGLALALGAACGAYLLVQFISGSPMPCGRTFTLPASWIGGAVGVAGALTGQLPWQGLAVLAVIPCVVRLPIRLSWSARYHTVLACAIASGVATLAVVVTWKAAAATA